MHWYSTWIASMTGNSTFSLACNIVFAVLARSLPTEGSVPNISSGGFPAAVILLSLLNTLLLIIKSRPCWAVRRYISGAWAIAGIICVSSFGIGEPRVIYLRITFDGVGWTTFVSDRLYEYNCRVTTACGSPRLDLIV